MPLRLCWLAGFSKSACSLLGSSSMRTPALRGGVFESYRPNSVFAIERKKMMAAWGYLGANFGKRPEKSTPAQQYVREKAALHAAQKYYTPAEFDQLMADLSQGLLTVRIYDDGTTITIDRSASP